MKIQKQKQKDEINLTENLLSCYKKVPAYFFDEKFVFNFEYLNRNINKMAEIQDDVNKLFSTLIF